MTQLRLLVTGSLIVLSGFSAGAQAPVTADADGKRTNGVMKGGGESNLEYVDPTIGNIGALLQPTRPTVQLPHQMIRMYPMRKDYTDDQIADFPLIIVSHRLGQDFSIKPHRSSTTPDSGPTTPDRSDIDAASWTRPMPYDQGSETTRPWYYSSY